MVNSKDDLLVKLEPTTDTNPVEGTEVDSNLNENLQEMARELKESFNQAVNKK